MTTVAQLVLNPFQENTFILHDDTRECIIIDPGCYSDAEKQQLVDLIESSQLKPVRLLNTHAHLDHMLGNKFINEKYKLLPELHKNEHPLLARALDIGAAYGIIVETSPEPGGFIDDGDEISFGNSHLKAILTPGHSPGSLSFYCEKSKFVIVGDVLFNNGIGRYDFPHSNYADLMDSITKKLFSLHEDTVVYPGHGISTTIEHEKNSNPFVLEYLQD